MNQCEVWGCDQDAVVIDPFGNLLCKECMLKECADENHDTSNYETYDENKEFG
jgi:hypothetical protein